MAVRTEAVQYHSCDLCEQDCAEADLARLYGPLHAGKRAQIDVCVNCQQRTVIEVVEWFRSKQIAMSPRPVRGRGSTRR
jgi:hypothetical protein